MVASTRTAISATLHCLTGCAIGEVAGMVIGTALGLHNAATTLLAIVLAFVFGYGLTMYTVRKYGATFGEAATVALAADTASITSMEIIDNAVIWLIPGAVHATLSNGIFWASLCMSLFVAFVLTVPLNRWLIAHGRGHVAMQDYHHH
jgi:hypothetical protein